MFEQHLLAIGGKTKNICRENVASKSGKDDAMSRGKGYEGEKKNEKGGKKKVDKEARS